MFLEQIRFLVGKFIKVQEEHSLEFQALDVFDRKHPDIVVLPDHLSIVAGNDLDVVPMQLFIKLGCHWCNIGFGDNKHSDGGELASDPFDLANAVGKPGNP